MSNAKIIDNVEPMTSKFTWIERKLFRFVHKDHEPFVYLDFIEKMSNLTSYALAVNMVVFLLFLSVDVLFSGSLLLFLVSASILITTAAASVALTITCRVMIDRARNFYRESMLRKIKLP